MRDLRMIILGLVPAVALAMPAPALAGPYDRCVALVGSDPADAEVQAYQWERDGGGAPAKHCRALALLAQGARQRAAEMMVEIAAEDRTLPDEVRSEMLVEAGEIYLGLGELALGDNAASRALLLAKDPRAALILAARLKAEQGQWQGAVNDLNGALARGEPEAELLVLRASARAHLGDRVGARADLLWATEIAPADPAVWLERGVLEAASNDNAAARSAWLKAIELDREGAIGEAARVRLQRMDAGGS